MAQVTIEATDEVLNCLVQDLEILAESRKTFWQDESGKLNNRLSSGYYGMFYQLIEQGFDGSSG